MSTFTHYRIKPEHQIPELLPTGDILTNHNSSYIENLIDKLKINITKLNENDIEFDIIGIDASIANALRRILLAEVPTIAIEHVWIAVNTSIIQDEVLAHRIGLIPLKVDPNKLDYVINEEETDKDTLVFHFDVECVATMTNTGDNKGVVKIINDKALSGSLEWLPQGNQLEVFAEGVSPVHKDIVIAKLKPGQRIEFEAHCRKGVGKDHTKFSPVATASYRLLPDIRFTEPILNNLADDLKKMCPMNVFDIEDIDKYTKQAVIARPRDCTMCRECIRHIDQGWDKRIELRRKANHFLFSVESVGAISPEILVKEALFVLKSKSSKFLSLVNEYENQG